MPPVLLLRKWILAILILAVFASPAYSAAEQMTCNTIDRQANWPGLSTSNPGFVLTYGDQSITFKIHSASSYFNYY